MDKDCIYCGCGESDFFPDSGDLKVVGNELILRNGWNEESSCFITYCPMCGKKLPAVDRM